MFADVAKTTIFTSLITQHNSQIQRYDEQQAGGRMNAEAVMQNVKEYKFLHDTSDGAQEGRGGRQNVAFSIAPAENEKKLTRPESREVEEADVRPLHLRRIILTHRLPI